MSFDDQISLMKETVRAAEDEIVMAVMFHETWRPAAYDAALQERMGESFATHSFQIVRWSLRREMLLALTRLWDTNRRGIRMAAIAEVLRDEHFFSALIVRRAADMRLSDGGVEEYLRETLEPKRAAVLRLVRKYSDGGAGFGVLKNLRTLRHQRLAHRQIVDAPAPRTDASDEEVESFYADNLELVRLLLSLVTATAFDFSEAASVYGHHAGLFWASVRGERTQGHPNYRAPT